MPGCTRFVTAAVVAAALRSAPAPAQPLTTAFTYQGDLAAAGSPAQGLHDLRFRLYTAAAGGGQVGAALCANDVAVEGGRFTVTLDFGPQFAGDQRFLEIDVRADTGLDCGHGAGFVTLAPRQAVTAAPHSLFALSAATAADAAQLNGRAPAFYQNAGNLTGGTLASARLSGAYSGPLSFSNPLNTFTGSGAGLSGVPWAGITGAPAGFPPVGPAGGDLTGVYPTPALRPGSVTSLHVADLSLHDADIADVSWFKVTGAPGTLLTLPFALAVNDPGQALAITNADGSSGSVAIAGISAGPAAGTGLHGESSGALGVGVRGVALSPSGPAVGGHFESASADGQALRAAATASSGPATGVLGETRSTAGSAMIGRATALAGATFGGRFEALSGSGVGAAGVAMAVSGPAAGLVGEALSTSGTGVRGTATAPSGSTSGGRFEAASTAGLGVRAVASASTGTTYGSVGQVGSNAGHGVFGEALATGAGLSFGVAGQAASASGQGVHGVATAGSGTTFGAAGTAASTAGQGLHGLATAATGSTFGISGTSDSASGQGVHGLAAAASGSTFGVVGRAHSPSGQGVFGSATAASGLAHGVVGQSASTSGRGLSGEALAATGTTYGVLGLANSAGGYGVFASGRLGASGTKSFRIDHPLDPENTYLFHYSVEAPRPQNIYNGTAALDGEGRAEVELPPYFAAINTAPRYGLTALGAPMPLLHVAEEIDGEALRAGADAAPGRAPPRCRFVIAGGAPGGKVSWRVEADRHDRWVRAFGAPAEAPKEGAERGTYQHPALFGLPPERGMNHTSERERPAPAPARPAPPIPPPPPAAERE